MSAELPFDEDEFRRWREDADDALKSARLQKDEGLYNWACFAAEQAAQLAIKALLHGLGRAPWGHDLPTLVKMVAEAGAETPEEVKDACARLSRHYIPPRYADVHPSGPAREHYTESDAGAAIEDAEAIVAFVAGKREEANDDSGDQGTQG